MKRQRSVLGSEKKTTLPTTKATKKKAKTRVEQGKEEVAAAKVILEDQIRDDTEFAEIVNTEEMVGWDEWACSWLAVDEQMSWGTCWSPSWDMELIGAEAYHALYSDVVWEDDLWDLKDIKNVTSSLPIPRES